MNPNNHIFTSAYRVKWLKSKLTQIVKINIDENNLKLGRFSVVLKQTLEMREQQTTAKNG